MSTPHNRAENGDFAKTVLMPGDPLRAKFIAETFLEDPRLVTDVRGMYGYTGTYQGRPISVMGSGMGMPSIGIYSYELYTQYGVENIIRIGSAGSYTDKAKLFDVVLATGAYSESNYAVTQSGDTDDIQTPSAALNDALRASAKAAGIPLIEGNIHSSDVFYRQPSDAKPTYWEKLRDEKGCLAVEMESFALFHNARVLGKRAACLLTISDSFVSPEITTAEQRQTSFTAMMKVALGVDAFLDKRAWKRLRLRRSSARRSPRRSSPMYRTPTSTWARRCAAKTDRCSGAAILRTRATPPRTAPSARLCSRPSARVCASLTPSPSSAARWGRRTPSSPARAESAVRRSMSSAAPN